MPVLEQIASDMKTKFENHIEIQLRRQEQDAAGLTLVEGSISPMTEEILRAVDRMWPQRLRWMVRRLGNPDDAEDCVQDIFVKIVSGVDSWNVPGGSCAVLE